MSRLEDLVRDFLVLWTRWHAQPDSEELSDWVVALRLDRLAEALGFGGRFEAHDKLAGTA